MFKINTSYKFLQCKKDLVKEKTNETLPLNLLIGNLSLNSSKEFTIFTFVDSENEITSRGLNYRVQLDVSVIFQNASSTQRMWLYSRRFAQFYWLSSLHPPSLSFRTASLLDRHFLKNYDAINKMIVRVNLA